MFVAVLLQLIFESQDPGGSWTSLQSVVSPQPAARFGNDAEFVGDVDGDGNAEYLVSAFEETVQGMYIAGNVYLINGSNGQVLRSHPGQAAGDLFGWAVFAVGDVNQDGIPEYGSVAHGAAHGAVGVRLFDGGSGALLHQVLVPLDSRSYGNDAASVGDWNHDGVPDYAVADYFYGVGANDRIGRIYFYSGLDGVLIDQIDGVAAGQGFGKGLRGGGDANGDGRLDLLVWSEWGAGDSVDVLDGASGSLIYRLRSLTGNGYFGSGMDFIPDLNGDGSDDILVGAARAGTYSQGEAYLFSGSSGSLMHRWYGESRHTSESFGSEVTFVGDVDRDGLSDWAIGSPNQFWPNFEGKVFFYSGSDGRQIHTITSAAGTNSHLGMAMDGGMDVNSDGWTDVLVTDSVLMVNGVASSGAAYVFTFDPFLDASDRLLSASAGGMIAFTLDFPSTESGLEYRLLASTNVLGNQGPGTKRWLTVSGVTIPLVETQLLYRMWNNPPAKFSGASGTLDGNGTSSVTLALPPGAAASEVGRTFRFAAVSLKPNGRASASSSAVLLTIVP